MIFFKRENKFVLDSSSIIDGRVVRLFEKRFLEGRIIIPVLVKSVAKKAGIGKIDRAIYTLKKIAPVEFVKDKGNGLVEEICVLKIAYRKRARVITASDEVCRLGKFYPQVRIYDIRDLHRTLMPIFPPNKIISVRILKKGLHSNEGVGYIEGVKIIIENGARYINQTVNARVSTMILAETGNLVFCTLENQQTDTSSINFTSENPLVT
jgi:uncharacterized protein YacL